MHSPVHGRASFAIHGGQKLFDGLPSPGRYGEVICYAASPLEDDRGELVRNGENNMEILRIEKRRPSGLDPFRSRE